MKNKKTAKIITGVLIFLAVCIIAGFVVGDIFGKKAEKSETFGIAMGTVVSTKLFSYGDASSQCNDINKLIGELENEISWREENSAVSLLNKNSSVACDEKLKDIFDKASEVSALSSGAFDITVGKLTTLWNIGEENARVPSDKEIKEALKYVDYSGVKTENGKISLKKGQFVDLGAVGKGLACDRVREYLKNTDVKGAVISVGGSVLLYGNAERKKPWTVAVRDPRGESGDYMGVLTLQECCISTSGDYERILEKDGKTYHHIIDPKTGYPSDSGLISVTVVSDSGFLSDALSTACFVLGEEEGKKLLEKYNAEGVFIKNDLSVSVTNGLSDKFSITSDKYTVSGE